MAPSSPSSEMETPGVDGLAWLGDKPGWIWAPGQDWGDPSFRRLMNLGSGAGVVSDFPPCRGDIPFAGSGSLNHSLSCTSDSGLLRMCQKSLLLGKQAFQPGEFGSSPPHTIPLVKEIFLEPIAHSAHWRWLFAYKTNRPGICLIAVAQWGLFFSDISGGGAEENEPLSRVIHAVAKEVSVADSKPCDLPISQ